MNLSHSELAQLMQYIENREYEGWYYGNKQHYEKRHAKIKAFVAQLQEQEQERYSKK